MIVVARKPTETIRELADRKNLFDCEDRLTIIENYRSDFPEWWSKWVSNQTENLVQSHKFIVENVVEKIPTLYIRYEDLVMDPAFTLEEVFRFVYNIESLTGTVLERRINEVCAAFEKQAPLQTESIGLYSPD